MHQPHDSNRLAGVPRSRPALHDLLYGLALLLLLVQFALAAVLYLQHARQALAFPYPLKYSEGPILDRVQRLAQNEAIYPRDMRTPPFTVVHQPPLFWLLQVLFFHLYGPAFWYGRLLSMLFLGLAAVFIGLSVFTLTRDPVSALISGFTLLAFPHILQESALNQPDSLALALSWAGLFLVLRRPHERPAMILAAALFSLAIYTHQAYFLAAPLAGFAWLLQTRRARQAWLLLGLTLLFCLAAFLLINLLTRGGFYTTLFTIDARPFSGKMVVAAFSRFLPQVFYLLISTLLFLIAERFGNRTASWDLLLPYFAAALLSAAFVGRADATEAAFFELAAAFSLAAGVVIAWVRRIAWLNLILVLLLSLQIGGMVSSARQDVLPVMEGKRGQQADLDTVYRLVQQANGRVLADTYAGMLPLSGNRLLFQPNEMKMLHEAGLWDPQPVIDQLNRKNYVYILLHIPLDRPHALVEQWSPEIRDAIYANYRHTRTIASVYIYEPRP